MSDFSNKPAAGKGEAEGAINLAQLPSYLGYQIRQAQVAVFRDLAGSTDGLPITPGEFSLLTLIQKNPGISQKALAGAHDLDKSTLSHAVKGLVTRKLILRERLKEDKRYYGLNLSHKGSSVLKRYTDAIDAQEVAMEKALPPGDRDRLIDMLKLITKSLSNPG